MGEDAEALAELLNGSFHAVFLFNNLVGYFCYGESAQVPAGRAQGLYPEGWVDIGLAMRPDLTGRGKGLRFFRAGLAHTVRLFPGISQRLTVATFNQRAKKVYERAGFIPGPQFAAPNGFEYLVMHRRLRENPKL